MEKIESQEQRHTIEAETIWRLTKYNNKADGASKQTIYTPVTPTNISANASRRAHISIWNLDDAGLYKNLLSVKLAMGTSWHSIRCNNKSSGAFEQTICAPVTPKNTRANAKRKVQVTTSNLRDGKFFLELTEDQIRAQHYTNKNELAEIPRESCWGGNEYAAEGKYK